MREFILWARKSPTSPDLLVEDLSQMGRITNIAQYLVLIHNELDRQAE